MSSGKRLYSETALIESLPLQKLVGLPVLLKLENTHPSGSFKLRGISHLCQKALHDGYTKVVCSSGGNAGLAAAYSARHLGLTAKIVVPTTTSSTMRQLLMDEGAEVEIYGSVWNEADLRAKEIAKEPGVFYVHPFDHPAVWEGHSTMIEEVAEQIKSKPSAVIVCVGGGGLTCGVLLGMKKVGWEDVPVLAMETIGADCFYKSVQQKKKVVLPAITSMAVCLGSVLVCDKLLDYLKEGRPILSEVVSDRDAVDACLKFADDHRILVEIACGASLAAAYKGIIAGLIKEGKIKGPGPVVIIVCGGAAVSLDILSNWKKIVDL